MSYINARSLLSDGFKLRRLNWDDKMYIELVDGKVILSSTNDEFHFNLSDLMSDDWEIKRN